MFDSAETMRFPLSVSAGLVATALSGHGLRKGSLSLSGAIAAFLAGYFHLAIPLKVFGVSLIVFYLLGSRATKHGSQIKATLEDGIDPTKSQGNRNWVQVLSNSLPSLVAALAYNRYVSNHPVAAVLDNRVTRSLIYAGVFHFSCSLGDTLASELGILSASPPISILTFKKVPPGTNGGVSPVGILYSALGGTIMGMTATMDLLVESTASASQAASLVGFATFAGLVGSLIDSVLGATCQRTVQRNGKILTDGSADKRGRTIGSGRDILSNSNVNLLSCALTAALGFWIGHW